MNRYVGRVVAITGAAQGLGLAMANRFAAEGAAVAMADVRADTLLSAGEKIAAGAGGPVRCDVVDVSSAAAVDDWIAKTTNELGRLDVLINNAGIIRDNRLQNIADDDWQSVLAINLSGAFYCARAAFAPMTDQGYGRIVSFSSMSWHGNFGQSNYAAAKAGIVGLTRAIALEGAGHGITANAIAPGLIDTPMLASMDGAVRSKLIGKIPMKRVGRPEDIAEVAAFLASPAAGYLTGVVLDVDGGISIGSSIR